MLLPYGGGDSDIGIGGGFIASVARRTGEHEPYLWRAESTNLITFKVEGENPLEIPYIDSYLLLALPHVIKDHLRLTFRVSYTREYTLNYYGLGNASRIQEGRSASDRYYGFGREHPTIQIEGEGRVGAPFVVLWGVSYTHNWLDVAADSQLAAERESGDARIRRMLGPTGEHAVLVYSYGMAWDTRDSEVSARSGHYHTVRMDLAPGGSGLFERRWARLDGAARAYVTIVPDRLVLAVRGLADLLLGDPPFYELSRYDETQAIGGVNGIRGVPSGRYYGKIKVITNSELRTDLFRFKLFGQRQSLGITGFFDAGRLWADYRVDPERDGTSLGLKLGAGGGLRIRGESFVLRADIAWSPDADPIGAYLSAGELF